MEFDYYKGNQADLFSFIRIPKVMLTDEIFSKLSIQSKVLYGLLLDRMNLSMKNGWLDKNHNVYIIYQISEIQDDLGFTKKKAIDCLSELENFGLVEKKKRGFGLPSIIYVKNFITEEMTENDTSRGDEFGTSRGVDFDTSVQGDFENDVDTETENTQRKMPIKAENRQIPSNPSRNGATDSQDEMCSRGVDFGTSRGVDFGTSGGADFDTSEVQFSAPLKSKTKINNTKENNTESNLIISVKGENSLMRLDEMEKYSLYEEIVKENIEYERLLENYPHDQERIDEIVDLILETVMCKGKTVVIASNEYPVELVKSKFLKLNEFHMEYVLDSLNKNTTKVVNIKKYILATLFNAPSTMKSYYQAEVNHDYPQFV